MTSTINSTGTASGLQLVSDASGALALQVGGTNVMAFSSSGILTGMTAQSVLTYNGSLVSMPSASTWYNGPNTGSIGAAGQKWLVVASGVVFNNSTAVLGEIAIHDGTNFIATQYNVGAGSQWPSVSTASAIVTLSGATTFTLKAIANTVNCYLAVNGSYVNGTTTYIYAVRLA